MKKVEAFVQPHRLDKVTLAMHHVEGVTGMSVCEVRGWGHGKKLATAQSHADQICAFKPHTKVEVVCADAIVEDVIQAIQKAAHTGLSGDGAIFVCNIEQVVRISTGERGLDTM